MIATAVASSEVIKVSKYLKDPQFLKTDPQFLKSAETPEKQPILGGKNCSWSLKKKFPVRKWVCHVLFAKKNGKIPSNLASAAAQTFHCRV